MNKRCDLSDLSLAADEQRRRARLIGPDGGIEGLAKERIGAKPVGGPQVRNGGFRALGHGGLAYGLRTFPAESVVAGYDDHDTESW